MRAKWTIGLAAASLMIATQAQATASDIAGFCLELDANSETLAATARTGCLSSGKRDVENSLALEVDNESAVIRVTGEFQVEYQFHIGPTDCMGSSTISLTAEGAAPRRYSVIYGERMLGVADFTQTTDEAMCFDSGRFDSALPTYTHRNFSDWSTTQFKGWQDWRGADLPTLLAPLIEQMPASHEGRPSFKLEVEKALWLPRVVRKPFGPARQRQEVLTVRLTQHGILDDAISGMRLFAIARQTGKGWRLQNIYSQQMCARGQRAGQWSSAPCP